MGRGAFVGATEVDSINTTVDVGDRDGRDLGDVEVTDGAGTVISPATEGTLSSTLARDIAQIGGQAQSAVDVAAKIDAIEDALASVGTDHMLVQENSALDVSAAEVDVDLATQTLARMVGELELEDAAATGTFANIHRRGDALQVSVEAEQTDLLRSTDQPLDVSGAAVDVSDRSGRDVGKARLMDESGTLVDYGPFHDRVTGTATNATINPGVGGGSGATIVADTSGAATLTVEVSNDGANWSAYDVSIGGSEGAKEIVRGFAHVRAQVDQNLNSLELSARGV